ncbi:MAG: hypothetical protein ABJE10_11090, partial [bacterium]
MPPSSRDLVLLPLAAGLTREFLIYHRLCPTAIDGDGCLIVAAGAEPLLDGIEDIAFAYRARAIVEHVRQDEVLRLIERLTTRAERTVELERASIGDEDSTTDVRDLVNQPPVIRYVNLLVRDAYDAG